MKTYPAKLLLFGEHTVNAGSQALAVPLPVFSAKWQFAPYLDRAELTGRQMQLPQFAVYLTQLRRRKELLAQVDIEAFREALHEGLIFESGIPSGYGAGSSGALVAAIFGEWGKDSEDWAKGVEHISSRQILVLKKILAQMEAFFHGSSSGTDPLVCFLQQPLLLGGHEGARLVKFPEPPLSATIFLLDTGMERKATPLIEYFLEKMKDVDFHLQCRSVLFPSVDRAITAYLAGNSLGLFEEMHQIGAFQLQFLEKMIPEKFRPLWQEGLDGELFKLKVCGAGGGGFLLGIAKDFESTQKMLSGYKLLKV
jgi:mevalonate kinase